MIWEPVYDIGCVTGRPVSVPEERGIGLNQNDEKKRWLKGSVHVHTTNSDGDSSPADVARWYRRHGYDFIILTDHNMVTPVEELNREFASDGGFLVISGEEISDWFQSAGISVPIHINALGLNTVANPRGGESRAEVVRNNIDAVIAGGGLAMVNHPNYRWALSPSDLMGMRGCALLEIANRGAAVNGYGLDTPGDEEIWDALLGEGMRLFGVASDDAHHFTVFSPRHDNHCRGWVMAQCGALKPENVIRALAGGDFYSSTGVVLDRIEGGPGMIRVGVEPWGHTKYRVEFIGRGGMILFSQMGTSAEYSPDGTEGYIRVRVTDSNGFHAWTQPVFIE
jgi:hypothetical protein